MEQEFELIAKTFMGLEPVLAEELTQLGANNVQIGRRMVSFTGDKEMMYRANFQLHTAIRVLKPIKHFKARSAEEVYDEVQKIKWDDILDVKKTFSVDSVVYSEEFRNSRFVTYKVKDAIVDWFREKLRTKKTIFAHSNSIPTALPTSRKTARTSVVATRHVRQDAATTTTMTDALARVSREATVTSSVEEKTSSVVATSKEVARTSSVEENVASITSAMRTKK